MLKFRFFLSCLIPISSVLGQDFSVGLVDQADFLRFRHLLGEYGSATSYCVRPIVDCDSLNLVNGLRDLELAPEKWGKFFKASVLQPQIYMQFNQHHPYGWSNGPLIPNKGMQVFFTGGVHLKFSLLELQYRPEYVYAQNSGYLMPNTRPRQIDFPDRFGSGAYRFKGYGQSFARLNLGPARVSLSNENIWWGPGQYNSILMSNNAPGFEHLSVDTRKPVKTPLGSFEGQIIGANMRFSGYKYPVGFSPVPLETPIRDTTQDKYIKNFNGAVFAFSPKIMNGLTVGVGRSIFFAQDSVRNFDDLFQVLIPILKNRSGEDGKKRNQVLSFFLRQKFKESNAEVYFEFGREDAAWDLEDLITEPEHTRAYLIGGRKLYALTKKDTWLDFSAEITQLQAGMSLVSRARDYSFYTHPLSGGYTHMGQVLGAGIGPGSNMQTASLTYREGFNSIGFKIERVVYNNDLFYTGMPNLVLIPPYFVDASKHYVDIGGFIMFTRDTPHWLYSVNIHGLQTYNFQWNYDPNGVPGVFRFPGLNSFSFNFYANLLYKF